MYGWEKFELASNSLKKSKSNKRKALENAYIHHILHVQDHDVPEHLLHSLIEIREALTLPEGVPPIGGHSGCAYAIANLSDDEVDGLVEKVHETYELINKYIASNA